MPSREHLSCVAEDGSVRHKFLCIQCDNFMVINNFDLRFESEIEIKKTSTFCVKKIK